jgi:hypothetical protein
MRDGALTMTLLQEISSQYNLNITYDVVFIRSLFESTISKKLISNKLCIEGIELNDITI